MSLKQQKNMLVSKIQNVFTSIVNIFVVLLSKSIIVVTYILKTVLSQFGKPIVLIFLELFLSMLLHSWLQAIAQVITNYQHSFINSNLTSKEATPIATSVITILISTCAVFGVALLNMNQNRDYSIKKKDEIYTVHDKI